MYVSMSRLRVDAGHSDALVAAFRRRAHLVDGVDGFVDLEVWRSDRDPAEILMVSRWRDRARAARAPPHLRRRRGLSRRTAPPSGMPAPTSAMLGGRRIALPPLAEAVAER